MLHWRLARCQPAGRHIHHLHVQHDAARCLVAPQRQDVAPFDTKPVSCSRQLRRHTCTRCLLLPPRLLWLKWNAQARAALLRRRAIRCRVVGVACCAGAAAACQHHPLRLLLPCQGRIRCDALRQLLAQPLRRHLLQRWWPQLPLLACSAEHHQLPVGVGRQGHVLTLQAPPHERQERRRASTGRLLLPWRGVSAPTLALQHTTVCKHTHSSKVDAKCTSIQVPN